VSVQPDPPAPAAVSVQPDPPAPAPAASVPPPPPSAQPDPPTPAPPPSVEAEDHTVVHSVPAGNDPGQSARMTPDPMPGPAPITPPNSQPNSGAKRRIFPGAMVVIVLAIGVIAGIWALQRETSTATLPLLVPTSVPATTVPTPIPPTPAATATPEPTATPMPTPTSVPTATPPPLPTPLATTAPVLDAALTVVPAGEVQVPVLGSIVFELLEPRPILQHAGHSLVYVDDTRTAEVDVFTPVATATGEQLDTVESIVDYVKSEPNLADLQELASTVIQGFDARVFEGRPKVARQRAFFTDELHQDDELDGWFTPERLRLWLIDTPRGVLAVSAESLSEDQVSFTTAVILATEVLGSLRVT